jgi:hypothetical protein
VKENDDFVELVIKNTSTLFEIFRDDNFPGIPGNLGFSRFPGFSRVGVPHLRKNNNFFSENDPPIHFIHLKMQ